MTFEKIVNHNEHVSGSTAVIRRPETALRQGDILGDVTNGAGFGRMGLDKHVIHSHFCDEARGDLPVARQCQC